MVQPETAAKKKFLELIEAYNKEGRTVGAVPSVSYAPTVFARDKQRGGDFTKAEFKDAMDALFKDKLIAVREYRAANRTVGKRIEAV